MRLKLFTIFLLGFTCLNGLHAQQVIEEVIAVIGQEIVLKSELESQIFQLDKMEPAKLRETQCWAVEQLLMRKMLLSKANMDTLLIVSDDQVEDELSRRIKFFAAQLGSEKALEEYYGKSIPEMKEEFRKNVKDQILAEQMQNKIWSGVSVTPLEVRTFFKQMPEDSLPLYSTEMEVAQIVKFPKVTKEERDKAIEKLRAIRQDIINGSSFNTKAIVHSQDNGSAIKGGELGLQHKNTYVPEFSAAAMKLKKGEISDVVETKFGFHIIQMIDRKGDLINVRHILIKPEVTQEALDNCEKELDSIRNRIVNDTLRFSDAAYLHSEDEETKNMGGLLIDLKTNSGKVPVDQLDPQVFFVVDKMKVGEISEPVIFRTPDQRQGYRLLHLKAKTPPHKANLKDDYASIKEMALDQKKQDVLQKWFENNIKDMYVRLNAEYANCENLSHWISESQLAEIGKK